MPSRCPPRVDVLSQSPRRRTPAAQRASRRRARTRPSRRGRAGRAPGRSGPPPLPATARRASGRRAVARNGQSLCAAMTPAPPRTWPAANAGARSSASRLATTRVAAMTSALSRLRQVFVERRRLSPAISADGAQGSPSAVAGWLSTTRGAPCASMSVSARAYASSRAALERGTLRSRCQRDRQEGIGLRRRRPALRRQSGNPQRIERQARRLPACRGSRSRAGGVFGWKIVPRASIAQLRQRGRCRSSACPACRCARTPRATLPTRCARRIPSRSKAIVVARPAATVEQAAPMRQPTAAATAARDGARRRARCANAPPARRRVRARLASASSQ